MHYMKSICLNMIVKDESKIIQQCLESVKSVIDYWVILEYRYRWHNAHHSSDPF